ncbi:MAG: transcription antitermination factor NusB [Granulosicoccus sp.]
MNVSKDPQKVWGSAGKRSVANPGVQKPAADKKLPAKKTSRKQSGTKKGNRNKARHYARERALQALYQWDVAVAESSDVYMQFISEQDMSRVDTDYFASLFKGVSHNVEAVDADIEPSLDRPMLDLDPVERAVLRIATYELQHCLDVPARVVINEGVEITKRFGADKGHHYVNGVLDKVAMALRPIEMKR